MIYFHLFYALLTMKLIFIECKLDECEMITFSWLKVNCFSNQSIPVALTPPLFTEFLIISKTFLQLDPFLPWLCLFGNWSLILFCLTSLRHLAKLEMILLFNFFVIKYKLKSFIAYTYLFLKRSSLQSPPSDFLFHSC